MINTADINTAHIHNKEVCLKGYHTITQDHREESQRDKSIHNTTWLIFLKRRHIKANIKRKKVS